MKCVNSMCKHNDDSEVNGCDRLPNDTNCTRARYSNKITNFKLEKDKLKYIGEDSILIEIKTNRINEFLHRLNSIVDWIE